MGWYESRRGYSTIADVCVMYGVTEKTVVRWIERGYLAAEIFEHEKPKYWILDASLQKFDTLTADVFKTLPNDLSKLSRSCKLAHKLEKIFENDNKEDEYMEEKHENEIEDIKTVPAEPEGYISVKELNHRLLKITKLQDTKDEFIEARLRQATQLVTALYGCEEADIPRDKLDDMRHLVYDSPEARRMENDIDNEFESARKWMKDLGVSDRLIGLVV